MQISIKKGMNLPISGEPEQVIQDGRPVNRVALLGADYIGLKPEILVKQGQEVKAGQALFRDKQHNILYTAPASGVVTHINRGPRRCLQSLEMDVQGDDYESFPVYSGQDIQTLPAEDIRHLLLTSGLWSAFRTRPFSINPSPETTPHAIFVTATDSNPLAPDPAVVINAYEDAFDMGLALLCRFFGGPVYLCKSGNTALPGYATRQLKVVDFSGPHPAGLVGTHIHFLDPVAGDKTVWHLGYQDVIAMGKLVSEGRTWTRRIVSVAGPQVSKPRLLRVQLGANLPDLLQDELLPGKNRIISGSVFSGRHAFNKEAYLGRYHVQTTILEEFAEKDKHRPSAVLKDFSLHNMFSTFLNNRYHFTTTLNGPKRPFYPLGDFERLMPLDILPTPLLRALLVGDEEEAVSLGCLELDEEDLALCTYACCSKNEYGASLRAILDGVAGVEP